MRFHETLDGAETGHKPNVRGALIFFLIFSSLTFITPNLRDPKCKVSFEADNSEILDPTVTAISFSSMKIFIFNQSPNASDVASKYLSCLYLCLKQYLSGTDATCQDFTNWCWTH